MGERYEMKVYDGTDPDAPPSWWEGWPLTLAAVLYAALHWGVMGAMIWKLVSSLFP